MTRIIIISGADNGYAVLLAGLLASIEAQARDADIDIGVLDLGLKEALRRSLERRGVTVIPPDWDYSLECFRSEPPDFFKAMTARPHLRRYFPGYDLYLWLDADTWVQDWAAVQLYIDAARRSGFAATPEVDRSYDAYYRDSSVINWRYNCFRKCFDEELAEQLAPFPLVNCGAFAARADAPHWDAWSQLLGKSFQTMREPFFFAEQTTLNVVIRRAGFRTAFLPSTCNWMCNRAVPLCSADGAVLLEPNPPFSRLGVIHMTSETKNGQKELLDTDGRTHIRSLRYLGHQSTAATPHSAVTTAQ